MQRRRIASGFTPFIPEIIYHLRDNVKSFPGRWIYLVLATCFPVEEDWDIEGEWVIGSVRVHKKEIMEEAAVSTDTFYRAWSKLIEAKVVVDNKDGTILLPMFKKKEHQAFSPREVTERLSRLEKLHQEDLEPETPINGQIPPKSGEKDQKDGGVPPKDGGIPPKDGGIPPKDILLKGLKTKEIKNSLSGNNTISGFYRGIGQKRISKQKRERGNLIFKDLRKDGFTPEDIAFAVEWTLQNAKEQPYDLSIIRHTIGQAIAAREKAQAEREQIEERERAVAEETERRERKEKEREAMESYKESLDPEEREALRNRAETELRESEQFKEEYITDILIEVRENQILREKLNAKNKAETEGETE